MFAQFEKLAQSGYIKHLCLNKKVSNKKLNLFYSSVE